MKRIFYAITLLVFITATAQAQYNLGVATGNWSGLNALYLNPANIADNHERFVVGVIDANAGANNDLGSISSVHTLVNAINGGSTDNLFNYSGSSKFSLLAPYAQVHLPGIMVSINHKHSFAITTSVNGMNQFNNFDQSFYRTLSDPTYQPTGNVILTSNKFNYTAHLWSQAGLTYGGVLWENDQHEIKIGATIRYLGGIGYLGLKGNNLDANYENGTNILQVNHSDIEYASNVLSTRTAVLNGVSGNNLLSEFFGAKDGSGVGGDIGLVYDFTPSCGCSGCKANKKDHTKDHYLLRLSASVMDIGHITYKAANNSNAEVTGNGTINGSNFSDSVKTFDDFRHYAVIHGFTADTSHQNTKVYMPTTLRLGADYHACKNLYVNVMYIGNLANRQNFGNSYYNQLTVTPRFDTRLLSVGVPITYDDLTKHLKAGVGIRFSGFFIGSDDMLALVAHNQSGLNVYAGGFVPFYKHKPKDIDTMEMAPEPDMEHGGSADTLGGGTSLILKATNNNTILVINKGTVQTTSAIDYFDTRRYAAYKNEEMN